jgi:hypothetical protein
VTTKYVRGRISDNLQQHWKVGFSACNENGFNEAAVINNFFSDIPDVFTVKAAQLFIKTRSLLPTFIGKKRIKCLSIRFNKIFAYNKQWINASVTAQVMKLALKFRLLSVL